MKKDEKEKPRSQIDDNNVEPKMNRKYGIMIFANESLTEFDIVGKFEYKGKEYEVSPQIGPELIKRMSESMELRKMQTMFADVLINGRVDMPTMSGMKQYKMPEMFAKVLIDMLEQQKRNMAMQKSIIMPVGGGS